MYKQNVANRLGKCLNVILYWWFFFSLYTGKVHYLVLLPHMPSQDCLNMNSATLKKLKSICWAHTSVFGTKSKCNWCDRIACQWCSLKSHKKRKYIKYQCDHCHYKPSKNQLKNNDRNIKGQINIRSHLPKPSHNSFPKLTSSDSSSGDVPRPRMILSYSQSLCINFHVHHPVTPEPIRAERWQWGTARLLHMCNCTRSPSMIILNPRSTKST